MEKILKCDICGGKEFSDIHQQILPMRNYRNETVEIELKDVMCNKCGLVFRNPQPTSSEINAYYSQIENEKSSGDPKFILASEHRESENSTSTSIKLNQFKYFRSFLGDKKGSILEIGCYEGLLLSLFKKDDWEVYGIEPSVKSSQIAKNKYGIEVKNEFLKKGLWKNKFDAAMMVHVLEHVKSPLAALRNLHPMIRQNGLLFVEVPDVTTFAENNLSSFFNYEHLYYFSPRSLHNLLLRAGYSICEIRDDFDAPIIRAIAKPSKIDKNIDTSFYSQEYENIKGKIERQQKYIEVLKEKLNKIISDAARSNDKVLIYGAGIHTEHLFRLAAMKRMQIVGIVDLDPGKQGLEMFGIKVKPVDCISDLNPDRIIISSYSYQEEIFNNLSYLSPKIKIDKLYEYIFELENLK